MGKVEESKLQDDLRTRQLEYLVQRFGKKILKLAYYHLRDRQQAEDIVQEVFCRVYQNLDSFRQESSYYTWIYRITVNLCKDYLRSAYYRRIIPWSDFRYLDNLRKSEERMFEAVEGGDVFRKVMDLPLKYRTVTALYYFEEMTTQEISQVLNIKENAVRTRLTRARKILRDLLMRGETSHGRQQTGRTTPRSQKSS
ncbi:MAG: sigma-70 family RNA polymerase sigma factor [Zhaonellaceae bacterium]|nr:sigma-70 family RNA polymerase sigma factor [Clostridia bacterium]